MPSKILQHRPGYGFQDDAVEAPRLASSLGPGIEPAVSTIERLKRRADFLATASGRRFHTERMTAQGRIRVAPDESAEAQPRLYAGIGLRVGFTITKRVGHATERNRIRRRLRDAVARAAGDLPDLPADIVLVARRPALHAPFETLIADLRRAVGTVTKPKSETKPKSDTPGSTGLPPARGRGKTKPRAVASHAAAGALTPSPSANACDGSTDGK